MATHGFSPMRFSFGTPVKTVMEFTAGSPTDTRNDDIFSKCELVSIELYTYEWTISNFSMLKPIPETAKSPLYVVGPCDNLILKIILSCAPDDVASMEIQLLKETKLTEEMKAREAKCPLASKLYKHILSLEFLDSNGKTLDYYKALPYEFKYINTSKVFAWTKEENVSRFLHNDTLTIRAKLSTRYYSHPPEPNKPPHVTATKALMSDMQSLFNDRSRFPDILVKVGGQYVLSHKSILYTQCPSFAELAKLNAELNPQEQNASSLKLPGYIKDVVKDDCEVLHIPNENADVFLSVLHFIYCKQMHATDKVDDFEVYEFAKKYGVRELSMLLMPHELKVHSQVKVERLSYAWYVNNFSSLRKGGFGPTQSPEFKTKIGDYEISWSVVLFSLDAQNIMLNLQRMKSLNSDVHTSFKLYVCKADGSVHDVREFRHLFTPGTIKNCHPGFMDSVSRFLITPDLLFNDILAVGCDLVVSCGAFSSDLKQCYPGEYSAVDFGYWTDNFKDLLTSAKFTDVTLLVEDEEFKVHKAILSARSPVFTRMFESDMEEKRSGCVRIEDLCSVVMKLALSYIYTGKTGDLSMAHAPELYRAADKYEIMDLKTRCSEYIMQNIDADTACEILILADLYNDENLKKASKNMICRNAAQALLSPHGTELITNYPILAHDILETLSVVFCSLPSQDSLENSFKSIAGASKPTSISSYMKEVTKLVESASLESQVGDDH